MVEKIVNNVASLDSRVSKNSAKTQSSTVVSKDLSTESPSDIKIEHKSVVKELASSVPIDQDKVSSIKNAISSGNYPLDLDKISDALMEAYNEMKS